MQILSVSNYRNDSRTWLAEMTWNDPAAFWCCCQDILKSSTTCIVLSFLQCVPHIALSMFSLLPNPITPSVPPCFSPSQSHHSLSPSLPVSLLLYSSVQSFLPLCQLHISTIHSLKPSKYKPSDSLLLSLTLSV
jgi:hypothetical protein